MIGPRKLERLGCGDQRLLEPDRRARRCLVPGAGGACALPHLSGFRHRRLDAARSRIARRVCGRMDGLHRRSAAPRKPRSGDRPSSSASAPSGSRCRPSRSTRWRSCAVSIHCRTGGAGCCSGSSMCRASSSYASRWPECSASRTWLRARQAEDGPRRARLVVVRFDLTDGKSWPCSVQASISA